MDLRMNSYMPTRLLTGEGCVRSAGAQLARLGKRCLLVTGRSSARACGALDDVTAVLEAQGIAWSLFDGIGQNPLFTDCQTAAQLAQDCGADFILGIGGGSPLDAAKCIAALASNPGLTAEDFYALTWRVPPLPIVAVGTTAGTGSEVTAVAVITTPEGRKKSAKHDDLFPTLALGDPTYTHTLPATFTRSTAIDAFAHCVESYFSRPGNEISRAYAVRGLRLLLDVFRRTEDYTCLSPADREQLYNASIYGGLAINLTGTTLPHSMGYLLTEQHGLPHGVACAMYHPFFFAHNLRVVPELTAHFLAELDTTQEEYLRLLGTFLPAERLALSEEEIAREHSRWINNTSMAKSWGSISPDEADDILRSL